PYVEVDEATGRIGAPTPESKAQGVVKAEKFLSNDNGVQQGIRKVLHDRNSEVLSRIDELKKEKLRPGSQMTDEEYTARVREISKDSTVSRPVVIIKATPDASWESVITTLDEMQINAISRYQLENFGSTDSLLLNDFLIKNPEFGQPLR
ncbi:MAG: hypothetical protein K2J07_04205, partial [Muribaculaceae bacterium]|nr:hypothetical protein [Muribaculaceae bacterium]